MEPVFNNKIRLRLSSLFRDFTWLILEVCYRRFGTNNLSHFQGSFFFDCSTLEDRAGKLRRNVVNKQPIYAAWNSRRTSISFTLRQNLKPSVTSVCLPPNRERPLRVLSSVAVLQISEQRALWDTQPCITTGDGTGAKTLSQKIKFCARKVNFTLEQATKAQRGSRR